ncbi:MAG: hypothetical protein ABEJ61_03340 [Haloferacaceae archaeon]
MTGEDRRGARLSRRGALAVGGAGLAALAGCAGVFDRGDDPPSYDASALAAAVEAETPRPPTAFPVSVPASMVERHRTRTRDLLDAVPEDPSVPNGVVTARLREQRRRVVESMAEDRSGEPPLDRLRSWRWLRAEAAKLRGVYRAATGDADGAAVADRRDGLRSDLAAFLDGWEYRGRDPVDAFAVHRRVERLVDRCRDPLESGSPFPAQPTDAVFRVGDLVGGLERAAAALADATALRDRYVGDGAPSRRAAVVAAADRLDAAVARADRAGGDAGGDGTPPFERDLENTPAQFLYDVASDLVERRRREMDEARERGHPATAAANAGTALAGVEARSAVAAAIRDGEYGRPADAARVKTERRRAETALTAAWDSGPATVTVPLARPAREEFASGVRRLRSELEEGSAPASVSATHVNWAIGSLAYAKHYARATPAAVDRLASTLRGAATDG